MRNLDIRVMVSDSGLKYTDIAKQMGISRQYLSLLMRYELTIGNREKILRAIKELKQEKERRGNMSAFYGTVVGSANTPATRRGSRNIKVAAQSWDGSVITRLHYNNDDLIVDLEIADGSATSGYTVFSGTIEELKQRLK